MICLICFAAIVSQCNDNKDSQCYWNCDTKYDVCIMTGANIFPCSKNRMDCIKSCDDRKNAHQPRADLLDKRDWCAQKCLQSRSCNRRNSLSCSLRCLNRCKHRSRPPF